MADSSSDTEFLGLGASLRSGLVLGLVAVDAAGIVTAFNAGAARLTGCTPDAVLGQPVDALPQPLPELLRSTIAGRPVPARNITLSASGQERAVDVSAAVVSTGGAVATLVDASGLGSLEEHFRRVDRLVRLGSFSATIAHEIKNALVSIKTCADLVLVPESKPEMVELVRRELRRIDELVSRMLKFSSPDRSVRTAVPFHHMLQQCVRLIRQLLAEHHIRLVEVFAAADERVHGNERQLEQSVFNLLLNAVEAMPGGGTLEVRTENVDVNDLRHIRIQVADTGTGVPPAELARLFDPFYTTKTEGTGLGLAITRRIIQRHEGTIEAESEVNRGTTFTILLPVLPPGAV